MAPHINLEFSLFFFLRKDEVITLQPFMLLSLFQRGGVSLIGKHSPSSLCFVMPENSEIILTSLFCSYVNIFRMTGVLWYCVKTRLLPSPSSLLLLIASQYISPSAKANENKSAVFLVPNSFLMWTGLTVGLCHGCPKQTQAWDCRLRLNIIITLKDLHWQREKSQEGHWAIAVQIAPPVA